jgi:hypothetical protein
MAINNYLAGETAMRYNRTGSSNLVIGNYVAQNIVTGDSNIYIGHGVGNDYGDESNTLRIGTRGNYPIVGNLVNGTLTLNASVTVNGTLQSSTSSGAFPYLSLTNTTNQLILGTTNTTTINSVAPSASRVYSIPDFGAAASFVLTNNTNTTIKSGTWTVTMTDGSTGNLGGVSSVAEYTQVGDAVLFSAYVSWTSEGTASGNIRMSLPFGISSTSGYASAFTISNWTGMTFSGTLGAVGNASESYLTFAGLSASGAAPTPLTQTAFGSGGGNITVSGYYRTV